MFSNFKITNWSYLMLALLICVIVIGYPPINTFSYDVFGYYMYLPLTFKYNDITIQHFSTIDHILKTYHASETFYQAVKWDNGNWVMRYPIGLSVLFSPFYFIANGIVRFTNYPADGFSRPYQLSILYGCLLYTLIGLHFVKRILIKFFDDKTSALTLICIALATNYFFHICLHGQGAMSHNLLFFLYAMIIYFTIAWHETFETKYILALGLFIGLAALCRPTEIISLMIPIFYGVYNRKSLIEKLKLILVKKKQVITFILVLIGVGFIQFSYWKYTSGHFLINPYASGNPGEGLELLHPHILEVLFSFRKGWFVYTPIMILAIIGFWFLKKENKSLFLSLFIYFVINFYVVSSWSCWWYGACFGVRSLIPSYAVLFIPIGYFIFNVLKTRLKYFFYFFYLLCIILNLFQTWQMSSGIMDSTNMSRAYYFSTFGQITPATTEQRKLLLTGKFNDGIEIFSKDDSLTHFLNFKKTMNFEKIDINFKSIKLSDTIYHSSQHSLMLNASYPYAEAIEMMHKDITQKSYTWIKASVWVYSIYPADSLDAVFAIEMKHKGYPFKFKGNRLTSSNFKPNVWNKLECYYLTPDDLRSKKDLVRVYFWNYSKNWIYIDDMMMESFEPKIDKSVF
ncbi:MAG: hypothetical protein ACK504_00050 [Bacteroidota bacterium]